MSPAGGVRERTRCVQAALAGLGALEYPAWPAGWFDTCAAAGGTEGEGLPVPSGLRAAIVAVIVLLALVPAAGVDASSNASSASSQTGAAPGYDISWPQCGGPYPADPAFGIVGVNKGIVYSANPCLASELIWAGGTSAGLYANTANPGPALSSHWPTRPDEPAGLLGDEPRHRRMRV